MEIDTIEGIGAFTKEHSTMKPQYTKENIIKEWQQVAEKLGRKNVSRSEFLRETGISEWQIYKYFDSYNNLVRAAGGEPTDVSRIPDEELWEAMYQAFLSEEEITTRIRFRKACRYNDYVYSKRWGQWDAVLIEFRKWVTEKHPDFPYLIDLHDREISANSTNHEELTLQKPEHLSAWPKTDSRVYGNVLNFRGLQHAPVNEQGVVFLFGMVALELGFIVESVATGYPDCEAKRRVSPSQDLWQRVKIEFEFKSRNFRDHGHDSQECDLIICWEDNWPGCPIEILELRSAIEVLGE